MSKAFDYVNHDVLLKKLEGYEIRGNVLKLLESYLSNRTQCTEISNVCPKTKLETIYLQSQELLNIVYSRVVFLVRYHS